MINAIQQTKALSTRTRMIFLLKSHGIRRNGTWVEYERAKRLILSHAPDYTSDPNWQRYVSEWVRV